MSKRPPLDFVNEVPEKRCELCAFWREYPSHLQGEPMYSYGARWATKGSCYRFPETTEKPATSWCGEYKADATEQTEGA